MAEMRLGLQARMVLGFTAVTAVGLLIAASAFVFSRHDEERNAELARVQALAPGAAAEFYEWRREHTAADALSDFVAEFARESGVRVVVYGPNGVIEADSESRLLGQRIDASIVDGLAPAGSWHIKHGFAGDRLYLLGSGGYRSGPVSPPAAEPDLSVALAVSEESIANAWLDLLPGLLLAAGIALPAAAALGLLVARTITRPIAQLTIATSHVAEGRFDIDVPAERGDEVGSLARSFQEMSRRVGETQAHMRQLVANVGHDLKTPLTSVLGFSRAIHTGAVTDPAEIRNMGAVIEEEANRLARRLDDLLTLSELDAGQVVVQATPLDLRELAASVGRRVFDVDPRPDLQWELAPGGPRPVEADPGKTERILENLLANARAYAPAGDTVHIRVEEAPGGGASVAVSNAGDLDTETVDRLFGRFERGDSSRSDGTGLGLAIARELARLQGGDVTADAAGGCVTFQLSLPGTPLRWGGDEA